MSPGWRFLFIYLFLFGKNFRLFISSLGNTILAISQLYDSVLCELLFSLDR